MLYSSTHLRSQGKLSNNHFGYFSVMKGFLSGFQTYPCCTPDILKVLQLNIFISRIVVILMAIFIINRNVVRLFPLLWLLADSRNKCPVHIYTLGLGTSLVLRVCRIVHPYFFATACERVYHPDNRSCGCAVFLMYYFSHYRIRFWIIRFITFTCIDPSSP